MSQFKANYNWTSATGTKGRGGDARSPYSNIKGGRIVLLENRKIPISTDCLIVKCYPFFQNRWHLRTKKLKGPHVYNLACDPVHE